MESQTFLITIDKHFIIVTTGSARSSVNWILVLVRKTTILWNNNSNYDNAYGYLLFSHYFLSLPTPLHFLMLALSTQLNLLNTLLSYNSQFDKPRIKYASSQSHKYDWFIFIETTMLIWDSFLVQCHTALGIWHNINTKMEPIHGCNCQLSGFSDTKTTERCL